MALDSKTYGTVARVEALVGDMVASRAFTTNTQPKKAQVEVFLDNMASELNAALEVAGYTVPVVEADDEVAFEFLRAANVYGACVLVLTSSPAEAGLDLESEAMRTRIQTFNGFMKRALDRIKEGRLDATKTDRAFRHAYAGSQEDSAGNTKLPIFTRDIFDYPGSRSLTE